MLLFYLFIDMHSSMFKNLFNSNCHWLKLTLLVAALFAGTTAGSFEWRMIGGSSAAVG